MISQNLKAWISRECQPVGATIASATTCLAVRSTTSKSSAHKTGDDMAQKSQEAPHFTAQGKLKAKVRRQSMGSGGSQQRLNPSFPSCKTSSAICELANVVSRASQAGILEARTAPSAARSHEAMPMWQ